MYSSFFLLILAKGLDLYQVLSPNAYSYKEEFIPVIRKTVQSQVHEVKNNRQDIVWQKLCYSPLQ